MNDQQETLRKKWQANKDKVAFVKSFPCLLHSFDETIGKRVTQVVYPLSVSDVVILIFEDHTIFITTKQKTEPDPASVLKCLRYLSGLLQEHYPEAFEILDELIKHDSESTRQARLQNILGAVRNNINGIPELYSLLPELLEQLKNGDTAADCDIP